MSGAERSGSIFFGAASGFVQQLAESLDAGSSITCPAAPPVDRWAWDWAPQLDAWRQRIASLPSVDEVVVCTWPDPAAEVSLADLGAEQWRLRVEWPTALWFTTLVAAAGRCRDGGALVAVVDRPATLDAVGQSPGIAVAEGVLNLVRSLAAHEGGRRVRVNAVVTSLRTPAAGLSGAPPPLATFPGRVDREVAGAVRLLLSPDASGVTGTSLLATCGRR